MNEHGPQFFDHDIPVTEEELRYHTLDALPDEFYRIQIRTIWRKEYQADVQITGRLCDYPGMVDRTVVEYHDNGSVSVRSANGGQKGHHIVRFGRFWSFQNRIAVDRIESEEIGSEFIGVLHDCRFARRPQANGVRRGLRRALVLESYHEIVSVEGIQSILESFFKTASASAGRRWSRG